jgi:outer membrane receptor protein involved in Fe transport
VVRVTAGTLNTDGIDANIRTNFDFGEWGSLQNQLTISYVGDYHFDSNASLVDDPSVPEFRAQLVNQWNYGDFSFAWIINHIDSTQSTQGQCLGAASCDDYGYPQRLPSWTTNDLQATWSAPWNGKLTIGVNNVSTRSRRWIRSRRPVVRSTSTCTMPTVACRTFATPRTSDRSFRSVSSKVDASPQGPFGALALSGG